MYYREAEVRYENVIIMWSFAPLLNICACFPSSSLYAHVILLHASYIYRVLPLKYFTTDVYVCVGDCL